MVIHHKVTSNMEAIQAPLHQPRINLLGLATHRMRPLPNNTINRLPSILTLALRLISHTIKVNTAHRHCINSLPTVPHLAINTSHMVPTHLMEDHRNSMTPTDILHSINNIHLHLVVLAHILALPSNNTALHHNILAIYRNRSTAISREHTMHHIPEAFTAIVHPTARSHLKGNINHPKVDMVARHISEILLRHGGSGY